MRYSEGADLGTSGVRDLRGGGGRIGDDSIQENLGSGTVDQDASPPTAWAEA
ncbi:hypothetical protein SAMN04515665_105207 [Blastococcus sp. DSM 46786]|nr:hypothetical protein SAMN04515665_105207 [Blastococcus sp. DSM 46786]